MNNQAEQTATNVSFGAAGWRKTPVGEGTASLLIFFGYLTLISGVIAGMYLLSHYETEMPGRYGTTETVKTPIMVVYAIGTMLSGLAWCLIMGGIASAVRNGIIIREQLSKLQIPPNSTQAEAPTTEEYRPLT